MLYLLLYLVFGLHQYLRVLPYLHTYVQPSLDGRLLLFHLFGLPDAYECAKVKQVPVGSVMAMYVCLKVHCLDNV